MRRRQFLINSGATATTIAAGFRAVPAASSASIDPARFSRIESRKTDTPLTVLVLGGTNFVGPPMVQRFLDRGHHVSLFNRGRTNPDLFPDIEKLTGNRYPDRDGGLTALAGARTWDVVVDTWRDNPLVVDSAIDLLGCRTGRYIFTSSIAVYGNRNYETQQRITEETQLPNVEPPADIEEDVGYRRSKIRADQTVLNRMGLRGTSIRCHGIYGYYMGPNTDGQRYWPIRVDRGGDILCPGDGLDGIQYVDVLDVADFIIRAAEHALNGAFNIGRRLIFRSFLSKLQLIAANPSTLHWVPRQILLDAGISPYSNVPLWVPQSMGPGFYNIDDGRAVAAGLSYRPFNSTFRDVINGHYAEYGQMHQFDEEIMSDQKASAILEKLGVLKHD